MLALSALENKVARYDLPFSPSSSFTAILEGMDLVN